MYCRRETVGTRAMIHEHVPLDGDAHNMCHPRKLLTYLGSGRAINGAVVSRTDARYNKTKNAKTHQNLGTVTTQSPSLERQYRQRVSTQAPTTLLAAGGGAELRTLQVCFPGPRAVSQPRALPT